MKLSEPETLAEEDRERAFHKTGITAVVSESIGEESEDGLFRFYKKCPHCGDSARRTFEEHDAHKAECWNKIKDNAPSQEEIAQKVAEAFPVAAEILEKYKDAEIPTKQKYIRGIDQCKRVLGRNLILGKVLTNNDIVQRGFVLPAEAKKISRDFEEIFNRSSFIRVVRVSETMDVDVYPWLKEFYDKIEAGEQGPVCEIIPSAGTVRFSDEGEEYLILGASNVWVEYPEPEEELDATS